MTNNLAPLDGLVANTPPTESIKYAGSKLKLLPHILQLAKKTGARSVFDGFAGSTRVSQAFAKSSYKVAANDISIWSKVLATCYLKNKKEAKEYQGLIDHLNSLKPVDGWFTKNYGGDCLSHYRHNAIQADGTKKPWQRYNTRKLDAIREEIDRLDLDEITKAIAITSLILALDQVDSSLGHFVSYLKDWSARSFHKLKLSVPKIWVNHQNHLILSGNVFDSISRIECDLAYYDPPYGSNNEKMPPSRVRYASYYHVWTTICLNDQPTLFGKAARRKDSADAVATSVFEEFRRSESGRFIVVEAIDRLLRETPCRWIILSYSSGGRATADELHEVIQENGELIEVVEVDYKKNVMANMKWTNKWLREAKQPNREFLFLIKK